MWFWKRKERVLRENIEIAGRLKVLEALLDVQTKEIEFYKERGDRFRASVEVHTEEIKRLQNLVVSMAVPPSSVEYAGYRKAIKDTKEKDA